MCEVTSKQQYHTNFYFYEFLNTQFLKHPARISVYLLTMTAASKGECCWKHLSSLTHKNFGSHYFLLVFSTFYLSVAISITTDVQQIN